MLIDWFTVGAQGVNFVVLVVLLERFLYRPILAAIDKREQRIAAEASAADGKARAAEEVREDYERKSRELEADAAARLAQSKTEAGDERARLMALAEKEALALRTQQVSALEASKVQSEANLRQLAVTEVYAVARRTLQDLCSVELEECIVATFVRRLAEISPATKAEFRSALNGAPNSATVRSRFDLSPKQREIMQSAINQTMAGPVQLEFSTSPTSSGGLEVAARGQRIAWSVDDFLDTLQQSAERILTSNAPALGKS